MSPLCGKLSERRDRGAEGGPRAMIALRGPLQCARPQGWDERQKESGLRGLWGGLPHCGA